MISDRGYQDFNIWEHSSQVKELYRRRCRREEPEMDCAIQAIELLRPLAKSGETLLDVGCGSGYFFHSVERSGLGLKYTGVDAASCLVKIGHEEMPQYGCSADQLHTLRLEDLKAEADHVVCLNVLSNIDNFHRPLERMLLAARKSVILRESCWDAPAQYLYVKDAYLDADVSLKVHVNTYNRADILDFASQYGFDGELVTDRRTQGRPESVIGYDHHWTFIVLSRDPK